METSLRPVRDSQRIRVYRANSAVLGAPLPHMDDVRMFIHSVITSDLWKNLFPDPHVWKVPTLKPGTGARSAHVSWHHDGRIEIVFPRAYRFSTYVLHELAHYGIGAHAHVAAHGPEFVGAWMTLVREFCNTRTTQALERAISREKVATKSPIHVARESAPRESLFRYDESTNTVIVSGSADYIDIDQLELF